MRRATVILCIFLIFPAFGFSQGRVANLLNFDLAPYHFGFQLGVNRMFFTIKTTPDYNQKMYRNGGLVNTMPDLNNDSANLYSIEGIPTYGFVIGIVSNLRLHEYWDLRFTPSLTFGERGIVYKISGFNGEPVPQLQTITKNIQSTFVEFPLWFRYKGKRIHNVRPYVLAGGKYALDLASNARKKDNTSVTHVFIDKNDIYADIGVGFDFYTTFFKFGTELRMSYGILDLLKHDNTIYTDAVTGLRSKIFQLNFTFE